MNKVHYNISGLQNPQMKAQVKNALEKLTGVQMVNVDLQKASIEVGYNEPTVETEIKHCIRHAGFELE
ncbi:MAG TPA: heavy metal-associated domain-containing protein [Patescibacteria group bacterium]|nr:heavy metal-associated domain-containing protein [Patescibacteria group bacterium]